MSRMRIYWYTMRPNQRPRWLQEVEAYLIHYQLQSHGPRPEDDLNALATSLSTRVAEMAHKLRSKVSVRRIKENGETVAVHIYRNALPILVIKNKNKFNP